LDDIPGMNLVTILLIAAGAIQALGLVAFLVGLFRAPDGFQDGTGFHPGAESGLQVRTAAELPLQAGADTPFGHAA
jgi:hypothetical protein